MRKNCKTCAFGCKGNLFKRLFGCSHWSNKPITVNISCDCKDFIASISKATDALKEFSEDMTNVT